jgi:hypothetical protein
MAPFSGLSSSVGDAALRIPALNYLPRQPGVAIVTLSSNLLLGPKILV